MCILKCLFTLTMYKWNTKSIHYLSHNFNYINRLLWIKRELSNIIKKYKKTFLIEEKIVLFNFSNTNLLSFKKDMFQQPICAISWIYLNCCVFIFIRQLIQEWHSLSHNILLEVQHTINNLLSNGPILNGKNLWDCQMNSNSNLHFLIGTWKNGLRSPSNILMKFLSWKGYIDRTHLNFELF